MEMLIKHSWHYSQKPELVWEFLTTSELIAQWLMANDFKPIVGHKFMFRASAHKPLDFDGNIYCEVLELIPNAKLSYSWKYGPGNGVLKVDSVVSWTLYPKDGGTEVQLEHKGLKEPANLMDYQAMNAGWQTNVLKMQNLISAKQNDEKAKH